MTDHLAQLRERAVRAAWKFRYPNLDHCAICDWPIVPDADQGCTVGNCSYRSSRNDSEHYRIEANRATLNKIAGLVEDALREAAPPSATTREIREKARLNALNDAKDRYFGQANDGDTGEMYSEWLDRHIRALQPAEGDRT